MPAALDDSRLNYWEVRSRLQNGADNDPYPSNSCNRSAAANPDSAAPSTRGPPKASPDNSSGGAAFARKHGAG